MALFTLFDEGAPARPAPAHTSDTPVASSPPSGDTYHNEAFQAESHPILDTPLEFLKSQADAHTRFYSARDAQGAMFAAFYSDGRVRLAGDELRLAGIVNGGHAHLISIADEQWSEMFVRTTPQETLQLELRDGPLDGRILNCEALHL